MIERRGTAPTGGLANRLGVQDRAVEQGRGRRGHPDRSIVDAGSQRGLAG
jgi:hypothetical protein